MISLALSVIVVSSMVALMGNSLGSATRVIQMTQLADELRNTMSMLTRDVRRANYNPFAMRCYANSDCGLTDTSVTSSPNLEVVEWQSGMQCLRYYLERAEPEGLTPGVSSGGAFRRVTAGDVGWLEMWVGGDSVAPDENCAGASSTGPGESNLAGCQDDGDNCWIPITDSSFVNITNFTVTPVAITGSVEVEDGTRRIDQHIRRVQVQIEGQLTIAPSITRRIEDTVRVRNDFLEIVYL
jgi:hypothetical protein